MVKLTTENFILKANVVHNYIYDYSLSNYILNNVPIKITCKIHGVFEQKPKKHLLGVGCRECKLLEIRFIKTLTTSSFIERALLVHGQLFSYEKCVYKNSKSLVSICCKRHGIFSQIPNAHLSGKGCQKCSLESIIGFTKKDFIRKSKGRECTFYKIKCWNEEEEFYKIGITSRSIGTRFSTDKIMPYNYEVLQEIKGEAGEIWDLEKNSKKELKEFKYKPSITFPGYTECYKNKA